MRSFVWYSMKVAIKDIMCDIKTINNTTYISDVDVNRILYPKVNRKSRGKSMSKDKICDLDSMIKINGTMYYVLLIDIDDCYFNNVMA